MINAILSLYSRQFPAAIVYMLQSTEYQVGPYIKWFWRTDNFKRVMLRRSLDRTKVAKLLELIVIAGVVIEILAGIALIALDIWGKLIGVWELGVALIVAYPLVISHALAVPVWLGRELIIKPKEQRLIKQSREIFQKFKGIKIAVAGSYGKTSMKELLVTVLSAGKKVAATPANKNVPVSHAQFAKSLNGDEQILIVEYGEGAPGDVERFARTTQPTHAVITGVAPAHLDHYKTLSAAGEDIFSLATYLNGKNVYVNGESPAAKAFIKPGYKVYNQSGTLGWKTSDAKVSVHGTSFKLSKGSKTLTLHSKLLGRHQIGPLSLSAALAHELGLSDEQVVAGVAATKPYEHRMEPYKLSDAWVIDDTYNGNVEGIRAGTELLRDIPAKRKWYITPGLVDQGKETENVHVQMGKYIAEANPDIVVLMQNSVTKFIQQGLKSAQFNGELRIEHKPLDFYSNLAEFIASGDLVLMQNDWTDNYA